MIVLGNRNELNRRRKCLSINTIVKHSILYYEGYSSIRKNDEFVKIQVEALKSTYEGVETISWKIKKLLKNEIKIPLNTMINFYDI